MGGFYPFGLELDQVHVTRGHHEPMEEALAAWRAEHEV